MSCMYILASEVKEKKPLKVLVITCIIAGMATN